MRSVVLLTAFLLALGPMPLVGGGAHTILPTSFTTQDCLNSDSPPIVSPSIRIAVVMPLFTSIPYSQYAYGSFYAFYHKHLASVGNITKDLTFLNTSVSSGLKYNGGWGHSRPLFEFFSSEAAQDCGLEVGKNVAFLSDVNISQGRLFGSKGSANFDVVVVGFSEYVTQEEYTQYKQFVASGGKLVVMSGDAFEVQVKYDSSNGHETFVVGHGFAFNGKSAWRSSARPFEVENTNWVGGSHCCFRNFNYSGARLNLSNPIGKILGSKYGSTVFTSYKSHEESSVKNSSRTSIIGTLANKSGVLVAAYSHQFRKGVVVCICIFSDDILSKDAGAQSFMILAVAPADSIAFHEIPTPSPSSMATAGIVLVVGLSVIVILRSRWNH